MAASTNLNALLRVPGRLCINPTTLSTSYPYGGTDLGLIEDVVCLPNKQVKELREEGLGVIVVGAINLGESWEIRAALSSIEQGLGGNFFDYETGSASGETSLIHDPVADPAGATLTSFKLLHVPRDEFGSYFTYLPACIAYPSRAAEIAKSADRPSLTFVVFKATPRSSDGRAFVWCKKEDLSLT